MSGVAVQIENANGEIVCEKLTDVNGFYSCDVCIGENYSVSVTEICEDLCINDPSTFDLVYMQQEILGYPISNETALAGLIF